MSQQPTGIKHDQGKPDMSLLSAIALTKTAEVMTYGKKKYAAHNWRGGFIWSRPLAAALRHLVAYIGGEDKDPETGFSHLAHCICCLSFILEFEETHKELDDRYKPPNVDIAPLHAPEPLVLGNERPFTFNGIVNPTCETNSMTIQCSCGGGSSMKALTNYCPRCHGSLP